MKQVNIIIDDKDRKVLSVLQKNSKLTTQQISKFTHLPITTVHNRIKKMEKEGVIKTYSVVLDKKKIGKGISAYIMVGVVYSHENAKKFSQEEIAKKLKAIDGVEEVSIVTGETDIILKISVSDIEELNEFVTKKLRNIEGIDKTKTMVVMNEF